MEDDNGMTYMGELTTETGPESEEAPPTIKRGRGRPRKVPGHEVKVKRPRGRPPLQEKFACTLCGRGLSAQSSLDAHMRVHSGDRPFACECGKRFVTSATLRTHQKTHSSESDCHCEQCHFTARQPIDVVRHAMQHHAASKPFLCEICGKTFVQLSCLQQHSTTHQKDKKNCLCDECDFRTHNLGILRSHKRNLHASERQRFVCDLCGAELRYRDTYESHMRRHFGEKPYKCEECGAAFASTSQLAAHRHIHEVRAHACSVCSKRFVSRHKLSRHAVIHTDAKLFSCPACGYCCNVKSNLKKHCHAVHRMQYPPAALPRVQRIQWNVEGGSTDVDGFLTLDQPQNDAGIVFDHCDNTINGDVSSSVVADTSQGDTDSASLVEDPNTTNYDDQDAATMTVLIDQSHGDAATGDDKAGNVLLVITECGVDVGEVVVLTDGGTTSDPNLTPDPNITSFHEVIVADSDNRQLVADSDNTQLAV